MYLFLQCRSPNRYFCCVPLHSKMYLFLLGYVCCVFCCGMLYIPKCIYFYTIHDRHRPCRDFLYIPKCIYFYNIVDCMFTLRTSFTFQNVSISTHRRDVKEDQGKAFTFQNVSISTDFIDEAHENGKTLHSKMYLFLLVDDFCNPVYSILYIPKCIYFYQCGRDHNASDQSSFTFQNVSISTKIDWAGMLQQETLHSKMYLFLLTDFLNTKMNKALYIPKCIYFYICDP